MPPSERATARRWVTDGLINLIWTAGVHTFRLARRANLSAALTPALTKLAAMLPSAAETTPASLPDGSKLWMPAGYRDARTVLTGLFQKYETELLRRMAKPGMTFVDVGAYVGYFTVLASRLVGSRGRVFAFEPEVRAYQYLLRNIAVNSCVNAVAINKAVSERDGNTLILVRDPRGPESFVTENGRPNSDSDAVVGTVTMDAFFASRDWPKVDIVKMNIEAGELSALRGMAELSRRNDALQLIMEFNLAAMRREAVGRKELCEALRDLGFRQAWVVERNLEPVARGDLLPTDSAVYNILLAK